MSYARTEARSVSHITCILLILALALSQDSEYCAFNCAFVHARMRACENGVCVCVCVYVCVVLFCRQHNLSGIWSLVMSHFSKMKVRQEVGPWP